MANFWQRFKSSFGSQQGASGGMVFVDRASTHVTRGSREIVDMYHQSPWLRATVSKIGAHVGSVGWHLYRVQPQGNDSKQAARKIRKDLRTIGRGARNAYIRKAVQQQDMVEITDHLLLSLWEKGNDCFVGVKCRELTQKYLDTVGECPWILERNTLGQPVEIWPIPPTWIGKLPTTPNEPVEIAWGQTKRKVPQSDVIWFRDESLKNPYGRGIGIAHSLSDELDSDEYASQLIKTAFENRGLLDVVISIEGAPQAQLDRAKAEFENRHRGWLKAGVPFFHSGKADVKVVSQSFSEMQLLQLREWERDTIISIYGVPPELLGVLGKSNRATILESREIMASEVLIPRLEYMRSVVNHHLCPQFGDDLLFDYDDPTPSNDDFRLRAMQANPASVTVREWREVQGLEDRGERDDFVWVPAGLVPYRGKPGYSPESQGEPEDVVATEQDATADESADAATKAIAAPVAKAFESNRIEAALRAIDGEEFVKRLVPLWQKRMRETAREQLGLVESMAASKSLVIRKDVYSDIFADINKFIRRFSGDLIRGPISDTTKEQIRSVLQEVLEDGADIKETARRIAEVFDFNEARGKVIARTEIIRASNYANYAAQANSGLVDQREWISTYDDRTRDSHQALDGQIVAIDKPFVIPEGQMNAGAAAVAPGDFGIAAEDIQCRCTTAPVIEDVPDDFDSENLSAKAAQRVADKEAYWKRFDERAIDWEQEALPLIADAFEAQKRAVLAALGA